MTATSRISSLLGTLLMAGGLVLGSVLMIQVAAEQLRSQFVRPTDYLIIGDVPAIPFPTHRLPALPMTEALPDLTTIRPKLRALSIPTPTPQTAIRIQIPAIQVNSTIVEVDPVQVKKSRTVTRWEWQIPAYAVGHHSASGTPGGANNIVLGGHNNTQGEVFRRLNRLEVGDEITLYTLDNEFHYQVVEKTFVPYRRDPEAGERTMQMYIGPTDDERLTLYSCYPYATNADRVLIVAEPVTDR